MKKKSFKDRPKEEGYKFLDKIFRSKSKGTIYKLDWILSDSADKSNLISTNHNIALNAKK
jgi:hypothetical protein